MKVLMTTLLPIIDAVQKMKVSRFVFSTVFIAKKNLLTCLMLAFAATTISQNSASCFEDITAANFSAGTPGAYTYISLTKDGEVTLKPAAAAEFAEMPSATEWNSFAWTGGSSTVSGGSLVVSGSRFNTQPEATTYGPGSSLEFVATFGAAAFQHIGFGGGTDAAGSGGMFNGESAWAMFSTGATSNTLYTRTGNPSTDVAITGIPDLIGTPHVFRINWKTDGFEYFIDGNLVRTETVVIAEGMRPGISDYNNDAAPITVDWIRLAPFSTEGTFVSRIYDAVVVKNWDNISWTTSTPPGTSIGISVRTGNSSTIDESWTTYSSIESSGANVGKTSRYIQYKADLVTTNSSITPALENISISCSPFNNAPVLAEIGNKSVTAGETLRFKASATDEDQGQTLTYSLENNPPQGASIDPVTGDFTWTPSQSGNYPITVRVTDDGSPAKSDEEQLTVTVGAVNQPPVLAAIGNKTATVGQTLTFTASATDPDAGQTKTFSLSGAPAGASIGATSGAFNWTPDAAGTFKFTVKVTDNGSPALSDEEEITVTVSAANRAPVLAAIGNKTATVGQTLTFTASATDPDAGQTKTFSLSGAPAGASINATSGVFSWTPNAAGTFKFTVKVTDNGSPALSDEEEITVTVTASASSNPSITLSPAADAFVRNGSYATTNYGTNTSLIVKGSTVSGYSRTSYLKFSLSSVSNVVSAKLRIYGSNTENTAAINMSAYGVTNDSWTETGITWNTAPASSTVLGSASVNNVAQYYEINVTDFVRNQLGLDKVASFLIKDPSNQNKNLAFNSKENASNRPQLVIETSTLTLAPIADAFVRNGSYATTNYGNDASLIVKGSTVSGYSRTSYLKFSLSSVSSVVSAKLRIYGSNTENTAGITMTTYGVTNDSWTETGITWNTAPSSSTVAGSAIVNNVAKYYEIDVTEFVRSQAGGDKVASFLIKDASNQNKNLAFNSKENVANRPQLVIETSTAITSNAAERPNESNFSAVENFRKSKVYPNPITSRRFNVDLAKKYEGNVSLQVIDLLGKTYQVSNQRLKDGGTKMEVDISNLSLRTGTYFLRINSASKSEVIKLIVQ